MWQLVVYKIEGQKNNGFNKVSTYPRKNRNQLRTEAEIKAVYFNKQ